MNRDQPSQPNSRSARKARERADRLARRVPHPDDAEIMISTMSECPHGTERGYIEFGCRCFDLGPPRLNIGGPSMLPMPWGCAQAGSQGPSLRRKLSAVGNADTQPLDPITSARDRRPPPGPLGPPPRRAL